MGEGERSEFAQVQSRLYSFICHYYVLSLITGSISDPAYYEV